MPVTTGNSYSASGALWAAGDAIRRLGILDVDDGCPNDPEDFDEFEGLARGLALLPKLVARGAPKDGLFGGEGRLELPDLALGPELPDAADHPAGQGTDRLHFLRLPQLLFESRLF